jgi:molybdate transport system substrate-binding protein
MRKAISTILIFLLASASVHADEALIAVATNFTTVAEQLKATFEFESDHQITISTGSTGSLYAQIRNGAPHDVFLAADQERPALLVQSGHAVEGSIFTYATGRLVLLSADPLTRGADIQATISREDVSALAIANPALAPYGIASREALQSLGVWDNVEGKIVMGENVGQTMALIATRNADIGIVSLSQVVGNGSIAAENYLFIDSDLHRPIHQDALLLNHGSDNSAARDFLAFLRSDDAITIVKSNGYEVD